MIYTLTLNPSLDYTVSVKNFEAGKINRVSKEVIYAGGKGINVSQVLVGLGEDTTILGFIAGFSGQEIRRMINQMQISEELIEVSGGFTRINCKVKSNEETDINGMGPEIDDQAIHKLHEILGNIKQDDYLIMSGSVPRNAKGMYAKIADKVGDGVKVAVDTTGQELLDTLVYKPFVIKPNDLELGEIFGVKIDSLDSAAQYAARLIDKGAENVLVSMGSAGAVLVASDGKTYYCNAPSGTVINTVGAGDSMLAGFIYGYRTTGDFSQALKFGVAAGSASAFNEGLATKEDIMGLINQIKVEVLNG